MQQMQFWIFWSILAAFTVCGCILTRKPTKRRQSPHSRPAAKLLTKDEARRIAVSFARLPDLLQQDLIRR